MSGVVLVSATSLAMLALLAFAVSVVGFLIQTSRHRPTRGWSVAAGASLVLHLVFGGIANAVRSWSSPSPSEVQASTPNAVKQATHDATATVTRVVDGDTIEISRSVEGLLTERLIGVNTPETHGRTQPYGPEASNFTRQNLEGKEVLLELDVEKVDPYGRLLAYVYLWVSLWFPLDALVFGLLSYDLNSDSYKRASEMQLKIEPA
jgi:micrococcal nuclease